MINGELIVDNFAGGGGASTGIELATGYSVDIAINHDPEAIKMHKANHPNTEHYCENVWAVDPVKACKGHTVGLTTKDRFGLVTIEGVDYQIVDIGLRMLEPKELYGCQGFPDDYIIDHDYTGKTYPRSEQVRRCGNAVCPPIPDALVRANLPELCVAERTPNMRIEPEHTGQLRFA